MAERNQGITLKAMEIYKDIRSLGNTSIGFFQSFRVSVLGSAAIKTVKAENNTL